MKKGAIVFKGKYGATRQYAHWLGHELDLPCLDDQITNETLQDFDFIILGSSVYYGKLLLRPFLIKHTKILESKKIFIFIDCATPDSDEKEQRRILRENIPKTLLKKDNTFFLPGKLAIHHLNLFDRTMLRIATIFEKKPERKNVMTNGIDAVSKDNLIDLFIAIKGYMMAGKQQNLNI